MRTSGLSFVRPILKQQVYLGLYQLPMVWP
ncbi:hypothetical protein NC653_041332 [Populus alba x Populus x berolinensis]|uniref:Uncharacterized protein n=1 Tax=Populus alba x Populus x berolinensis TaxID=444605 RepID=A0AAD6L861_9ROSI|nr:hypothetical protein NC653_041332 [Populus alba x Populus x berolinensis]